jgi:peptidoglycan hydrolase-like protein with peptidoglycan-binding domain/lipoprotein-anchoring transpeptidase ErfK/SrfK
MRASAVFGVFALIALAAPPSAPADTQPGVAALQVALQARGLYRGPVDGRLGPKTRHSVRALQRRQGLRVDGIPGPETRAALGRYGRFVLASRFLQPGAEGWDVAELQFILASHGLFRLRPDGHYGVHTASAVRMYQRRVRITVDGVAGPATFAALESGVVPGAIVSLGGSEAQRRSRTSAAAYVSPAHLSLEGANTIVPEQLRQPLVFVLGSRRWSAMPSDLGAQASVTPASRAHRSRSRARPTIAVDRRRVAAYVAQLARIFDRRPVKARLLGVWHLRPLIAPERVGLKIEQAAAVNLIARRLQETKRRPVRLPHQHVDPATTQANFGPIIVVRRDSHRLSLYAGTKLSRVFRIGTGSRSQRTPLGRFTIVSKERDPWWYPPSGRWAAHRWPMPPGPGNPLGTRWMGLSVPEIGIHGTLDATSIGYSRSHGCVHMRVPEAEWLFERVRIGTPVIIVRA